MIRVALVDDDQELLLSYDKLLNTSDGFCCVGHYRNCEQALKHIENECPDVILLDVEMPGFLSGIAGVMRFKEKVPKAEIIMMTVHSEPEIVFEALRAGASGYLLKNIGPDRLLTNIREVYEGGAPMDMNIARMVIHYFQSQPSDAPLSVRQREVLQKLLDGKSYKAIADDLFISKSTVKFHIKNIYQILHVTSRAELFNRYQGGG
jgi:DNA-binding NarL/FixJ family response regulator